MTFYLKDISVMKTMKSPPDGVKLVMEVICFILGKITDKEISANKENTWNHTKKLLNDSKFIDLIKNFDKVYFYLFIFIFFFC